MQLTRLILGAALCAGAVGAAQAQDAGIAALFSQADAATTVDVSFDGRYIAVDCAQAVTRGLCIHDLTGERAPVVVNAPEEARGSDAFWLSERHAAFNVRQFEQVRTAGGLREYPLMRSVAYDLATGTTAALMRNVGGLTSTAGYTSLLLPQPETILHEIRVSDARVGEVASLFEVDLTTGSARVRDEADPDIAYRVFDPDGTELVRVERRAGEWSIYDRARGNTVLASAEFQENLPRVFGLWMDGEAYVVGFERGALRGIHLMSREDGLLDPHPLAREGLLYGVIEDRFTGRIVGLSHYENGLLRQTFEDAELAGLADALARALQVERVALRSWSRDRQVFSFETIEAGRPGVFHIFDRRSGQVMIAAERLAGSAGRVFGETRLIRYAAADGLGIEAVLTLPAGRSEADGPFPLIVLPHGGPQVHDMLEFDWWAQAYAALGYVVLQPNFRGSSGYGEAFIEAGYGEFGRAMIEDIAAGAAALAEAGLAQERYCVAGASYGGYAALMTAIRDSQDVACVIAVNAVTLPEAVIGGAASGFDAAGARHWARYLGPRFNDAAYLDEISPGRRARDIAAPVLLIQSREDVVVPLDHAYAVRRNMNERQLRYVEMEGQDHYLDSGPARRTVLEESIAFLQQAYPPQ